MQQLAETPAALVPTFVKLRCGAMDKQSMLALGVTAGVGIGYLIGRTQPDAIASAVFGSSVKSDKKSGKLDEIEQLIRPNILALTPYRCARDDYDQGKPREWSLCQCGLCSYAWVWCQASCWMQMRTVSDLHWTRTTSLRKRN